MASLRRTRTMPNDAAIAKFLYTILKQLDLKPVNWSEVASSLDITNGHAARMRFSRFKQQMEGIKPKPQVRKSKPNAHRGNNENNVGGDTQELGQSCGKQRGEEAAPYVKPEIERLEDSMVGIQQAMASSVQVKTEPMEAILQPLAGLPSVLGNKTAHQLAVHGGLRDVALPHEEQTKATTATNKQPRQDFMLDQPIMKPETGIKTEPC